jgi:cytoskeleton protein RodZ
VASLGQDLKKERESRNISLDEMASSTKIVGRYLAALENDRLGDMPGGFFVRGIIRTYATYLGLDVNEVLSRYEEAGLLDDRPDTRAAAPNAGSLRALARTNRVLITAVIAAGIILILVALMFLRRSRRPRPLPVRAPQAAAATLLPQAQPYSPPPPPAEKPAVEKPADEKPPAEKPAAQESAAAMPGAEPAKEESKGLTMDISFQADTWIQVYADGSLKISGLFPAGQQARVQAEKEIRIDLGNAGGLTFLLNGKPGKALGKSGEVIKDIRITAENFKDFLSPEERTGPSR